MAHDALHDLTPAYALDALDPQERAEFERHLATCERCRAELATLQETASSLAYASPAPLPPDALRDRVLEQARRERGDNVVPLRPRSRLTYALGVAAAAAASVAVALGVWAASLSDDLDAERSVVEILADPARSLDLAGGEARVVVSDDGEAALVVAGLEPAPEGRTYEIWVLEDGEPRRAGEFEGTGGRDVVRLTRTVPPDAGVAVTVERDGGVDRPTSDPILATRS